MAITRLSSSKAKFWDQKPATLLVEALVIAGGGGGSDSPSVGGRGGAGGAGGLLYFGSDTTPKTPNGDGILVKLGTTYTVTVGSGGGRVTQSSGSTGGANSSFAGAIAIGGGFAGPNDGQSAGSGGSGGGAWYTNLSEYGKAVSGQGNRGGWGQTAANHGGGGGGGAGTAGEDGLTSRGGNGGNGLQYSISGTATYYAGGGSADTYAPYAHSPGTAGLGGGGTGYNTTSGYQSVANGTANTGGGAGSGGLGGSGIVIIRYPDTNPAASATTGSPTITVSGGWRVYKFTGDGSITF